MIRGILFFFILFGVLYGGSYALKKMSVYEKHMLVKILANTVFYGTIVGVLIFIIVHTF
ncbi:MAG TPA: hypothetical protein VFM18_06660 [Methanosarcina sp.]|nr:hypothetical protein [Methanosarcina sp.]